MDKSKTVTVYAIYDTVDDKYAYFDASSLKLDSILRKSSKFKSKEAAQTKFDDVLDGMHPDNDDWFVDNDSYSTSELNTIRNRLIADITKHREQCRVVKVVTKITVV